MVYDEVRGELRLAPVYDLVTTTAYLRENPEFGEVGTRMLQAWNTGIAGSLRG